MLIDFFYTLRAAGLKVSVTEFLSLLAALRAGVLDGGDAGAAGTRSLGPGVDGFYHLARLTLVKDETQFDKFDRAFGAYFKGIELLVASIPELPDDWLRRALEREFGAAQRAQVEAMDWDELMATLQRRLEEQKGRHEGGSKWIGTGGTSPFGHGGHNPAGIRIGGDDANPNERQHRAVKVWDQRSYRDYDDEVAIGTRQIKVALRKLRRFAREGAAEELDLDDTIHSTAANAGLLDIKLVPERHNHVKVLLLMDVGGSMDEHVHRVEGLFSAAKGEFKHLEFFYFHNCVYDFLWKHNRRRHTEKFPTWDVIHKYNRDHKLIFVGDATMSPYEILQVGGSVEHHNAETGAQWLQRLTHAYPKHAWINPEPTGVWPYRQSVGLIQQLIGGPRMVPLTLAGLEQAVRLLST